MTYMAMRDYEMIDEKESLAEVRKLANWLDSKFELPFGWRVGWDGILGLIPGIGDFTTSLLSFYIIYKAAILGCPFSVVLRMILNVLIDNVLDTVPIIGNIFDFVWKSNMKNLALLESYLQSPHRTTLVSRVVVLSALLFSALAIIGVGVLTFYMARWIWGAFQTAW